MKFSFRSVLVVSLMGFSLASFNIMTANVYAQEEPFTVFPFKGVYSVGMTVTLFGDAIDFTPNDNVAIRVTNPTGQTYQQGNAALDMEGSYTFQFRLEGPAASVLGIHNVEATYRGMTAQSSFEVKERPTLSVELDKSTYDIGDFVTVSGNVQPIIREPIEIRIWGFNNTVWRFVTVSAQDINPDGSFSIEVGELLGRNVKPGNYRLEASYADGLANTSTQFNVIQSGKAVVGRLMPVDQSGNRLEEIFTGQQVLIQADVRNNLDERQPFAYLVQIKDENGFTVSLSWITGTLPPSETLSAAQSWIPDIPGSYTVEVFLWESVFPPNPIYSKVPTTTLTVSP